MPWALGSTNQWELGNGQANANVIDLAHTPGSITVQGRAHEFGLGRSLAHTPGSITLDGKNHDLLAGSSLAHQPGSITIQGKAKWWFEGPHWQYITVTDLSKVGQEPTLADALVGVSAEIGGIWRVPTQSSDGGAVTVFGDMTFSIGPPTAGGDVLPDVLYWETSNETWHGPLDLTVDDPAILDHAPGSISIQGKSHEFGLGRQLEHSPGSITVQGKNHVFNVGGFQHQPGSVVIQGQDHSLQVGLVFDHTPGSITLNGKNHDLVQGLSLEHLVGSIVIQGKAHTFVAGGETVAITLPGIADLSVARSVEEA